MYQKIDQLCVGRSCIEKRSLLNYSFDSGGGQTWVNIAWTISSIAISYSMVKKITPLPAKKIENWLVEVASKQISNPGSEKSCCNNLLNWRSLQATIVGALAGHKDLFEWGIDGFKKAISTLDADGAFTYEMKHKKSRALNYQNFAIWPLVYIAQIAQWRGLNLYDYKVDKVTLKEAIIFLLDAIEKPDLVAKKSGFTQDLAFLKKHSKFNWIEIVNAKFPDLISASFLCSKRPIYHRYGGHSSVLFREANKGGFNTICH